MMRGEETRMIPDGESETLRLIRRIDRRLAVVGHLIGLGASLAVGYLFHNLAQQSFGLSDGWASGVGVVAFFVAGTLFNRDFD
jgi:hypothetical protein